MGLKAKRKEKETFGAPLNPAIQRKRDEGQRFALSPYGRPCSGFTGLKAKGRVLFRRYALRCHVGPSRGSSPSYSCSRLKPKEKEKDKEKDQDLSPTLRYKDKDKAFLAQALYAPAAEP